jgi:hypothetical protein
MPGEPELVPQLASSATLLWVVVKVMAVNPLAQRVSDALEHDRPEWSSSKQELEEGDVEFHILAPSNSRAGALVVSTARGEDIWIRFAPPHMFYGVEDEAELLGCVHDLLTEQALFVEIVDSKGKWAGTTLVRPGQAVDLEPGQNATVLSWSGRFDAAYVAETPAPSWIEFHDSRLVAVNVLDACVELVLDAYVHAWDVVKDTRRGTGWTQPVRITLTGGDVPSDTLVTPAEISNGRMGVGALVHDNLVPLPFGSSETTDIRLEFADAHFVELHGTSVSVEAAGAARYVEQLPADLWPGRVDQGRAHE